MAEWLLEIKDKAVSAFIEQDRWKLYLEGFGVTLQVAFFAAIIGIVIGVFLFTIYFLPFIITNGT